MSQRRKRNSSKVNLTISFIVHSLLVAGVFFLAAREGILGKQLKSLAVTMVPKEKKPPEPPKEKPAEPKTEPPKQEQAPKMVAATPPPLARSAAPPPPVDSAPVSAPAPVSLPAFDFSDGAKETVSVSDPTQVYKGLVEFALRSRWNRPEDIEDATFAADVEVNLDPGGKLVGSRWLKGSGNGAWDNSVKAAIAATKAISRPPPKGFPGVIRVRFDVVSESTESVMRLSSR